MRQQAVSKAQQPKNSTLLTSTSLQRKTVNQTEFGASKVDTQSSVKKHNDTLVNPDEGSHSNYDFSKIPITLNSSPTIQTKLKIGQPNDKYEQEADRVAEQVMQMSEPRQYASGGDVPSPLENNTTPGDGAIQRACTSCSEDDKTVDNVSPSVEPENLCPTCQTQEQGLIQTKSITRIIQRQEDLEEEQDEALIQEKTTGGKTPEVSPEISSGIQSLQGGGRPLPGLERSFFEPRFGTDFSNVRIHNDSRAASVARSVNARAFTHGRNVVFGAGEYSPDTLAGRKLLAHELTHVLQQYGGPTPFSKGKNSENKIPNSQELGTMSPEFPDERSLEADSFVENSRNGFENSSKAVRGKRRGRWGLTLMALT